MHVSITHVLRAVHYHFSVEYDRAGLNKNINIRINQTLTRRHRYAHNIGQTKIHVICG